MEEIKDSKVERDLYSALKLAFPNDRLSVSKTRKLSLGMTNFSYLTDIEDREESLVIRVSRDDYSRSDEFKFVDSYMIERNPSKYTVYYRDDKYLISSYINQKDLLPNEDSILDNLYIIHNKMVDCSNITIFNPLEMVDSYQKEYMRYANLREYQNFYRYIKMDLEYIINTMKSEKLVTSHNDFIPYNILSEDSDSVVVIDWEYAGSNYREFDYSSFILESFNDEDEVLYLNMLSEYRNFVDKSPEISLLNVDNIVKCMMIQDLLWSMWTIPRLSRAKLIGDRDEYESLESYLNMRYDRYLTNKKEIIYDKI